MQTPSLCGIILRKYGQTDCPAQVIIVESPKKEETMPPTEAILSALECNWHMVDAALEGLDEAMLNQRPHEQCNSIA